MADAGGMVVPSRSGAETAEGDESWYLSGSAAKRTRKKTRRREREGYIRQQSHMEQQRFPFDIGDISRHIDGGRQPSYEPEGLNFVVVDGNGVGPAGARAGLRRTSAARPPRAGVRRAPRMAAVCIKRDGDGLSYAQILHKAREQVELGDIGIEDTRIR